MTLLSDQLEYFYSQTMALYQKSLFFPTISSISQNLPSLLSEETLAEAMETEGGSTPNSLRNDILILYALSLANVGRF